MPTYEIYCTRGGFYVLRIVRGEEAVIERFDCLEAAETFIAVLDHIADAPRRRAMH